MGSYWLKRNSKLHGPFSIKQLRSGLASGKIKEVDLVSENEGGPWTPILETLSSPDPKGNLQERREGRVEQTLFPCPDCQKRISRKASSCPHCGCPIEIPRNPDGGGFSQLFRKGADSISQARQAAKEKLDNVVAETRRAVDDKENIEITSTVIIGRSAEYADWVIPETAVSRTHAKVSNKDGNLYVKDLKSRRGTFVNGEQITGRSTRLVDGDLITLGSAKFTVDGVTLVCSERSTHAHLECEDLTRVVEAAGAGGTKTILNKVTINIPPKSFVVLLGPSGSGKSTLMNALNGRSPATSGKVLLNKELLYPNYNRLKSKIANVPQKDILHFELPLRESLEYTAELKLPRDSDKSEISTAVTEAIQEVGMGHLEHDVIKKFSGGQIKRASVAHEILSSPSLICVDEATSGLDEHSDREIMGLLREVSDSGKTILCITHNLANVAEFSDTLVIMAEGGFLAFCGPPEEAMAYFGIDNLGELYPRLKHKTGAEWGSRWTTREQETTANQKTSAPTEGQKLKVERDKISPLQHVGIAFQNGGVVLRRIRSLFARDSATIRMIVLQPIMVFLVVWMVFGTTKYANHELGIAFLLVVSTFWFGCSNSAKEVVKERDIFEKERHSGLSALGYIGAKTAWLYGLTLLQSCSLFFITCLATGSPLSTLDGLPVIGLLSICGVALGLLISVFSKNTDVAASAVPLAVIPQVVLGGLLKPTEGIAEFCAAIFAPCYWGYGMLAQCIGAAVDSQANKAIFALYTGEMYSLESYWFSATMVLLAATVLLSISCIKLSGVKVKEII